MYVYSRGFVKTKDLITGETVNFNWNNKKLNYAGKNMVAKCKIGHGQDREHTDGEYSKAAAKIMADTIEAGRWVHTFGCGHATLPIEEMYPRIGGFVGFTR